MIKTQWNFAWSRYLGQTYCCVQCYFVKTIYSLVYIDVLIVLLLYYRHRLQCWCHCLGKNSTEISGHICSFLKMLIVVVFTTSIGSTTQPWWSSTSSSLSRFAGERSGLSGSYIFDPRTTREGGDNPRFCAGDKQSFSLWSCDHFWTGLVVWICSPTYLFF